MILPLAILAAYIVFCILVGLCGSQRRMGFTGTFLLSVAITPVIGLLVLLITGPSRRAEMARRAGFKLDLRPLPWGRALQMAREQKDLLLFTVARTPERETWFQWKCLLIVLHSGGPRVRASSPPAARPPAFIG